MGLSLLREAGGNLLLHKGRSFLAALGIIFGVASVICMLSISEVARRDVIGRIERLGLRNIILDSRKPERVRNREKRDSEKSWLANYGLTLRELDLVSDTIGPQGSRPALDALVPMRILFHDVRVGSVASDATIVATTADYPAVMNHSVSRGRFLSDADEAVSAGVCALGATAARELFPLGNPVGQVVEIGSVHFKIVGVMEPHGQTGSSGVLSHPDKTVWIPFETSFVRFGKLQVRRTSGVQEATKVEVNRAVMKVADGVSLRAVASVANNLIDSRHRGGDVVVTVPHTLLREHRKAERIFRWVMASLAAISLLVGGVGIMNIMLANMAERRQEIGLRRALGATRLDIVRLFIAESFVLCLVGSVLGVASGAGLAVLVGQLAQWTVVFEPISFPLGIIVGASTGLLFGTLPAMRAARLDPVLALRVE
ncbi:MAG: hypothetical protein CMJ83_01390 [Planctomycetes bacterium]|nr:hypothetical protein [Planctomycetota bacterium]